ncbi:MAG: [FeFe] hydrogenase H-cluster radical SAM maturase HydG [Spirochaetales bacterium]|nr:[FeFe] hydrogenase H-cluster radical SAM maturase HydG [Spirochaetales bacterium]
MNTKEWIANKIKQDEIDKFLNKDGSCFINDELIFSLLKKNSSPSKERVREIIAKAKGINRLELEEAAVLLNVEDEDLWQEIFEAGMTIKKTVYGPRVVTFAPFYPSNLCVNNCLYCSFREKNTQEVRKTLSMDEIARETQALVAMGHKRLIMAFGEHPKSDADYIVDAVKTVYDTKFENGEIRRVNINCAPMSVEDLRKFKEVGIGTYQVFQETYHRPTYGEVHPTGIKADYLWRLYSMHRAYEAGVDDLGIGVLFGLYDWRFEVMALLAHTIELESKFGGVGPHTISFPRLKFADNACLSTESKWLVSDEDFKKLIGVIRLMVPYTGMIISARESAEIRNDVIKIGCTQFDASSKIGIGSYSESNSFEDQDLKRQQFSLGDTRSLDQAIQDMASFGFISSFCTSCYRCKRTGEKFMDLAKDHKINHFCMPNAILTFKEYLLDYASEKTKSIGDDLIEKEIANLDEIFVPIVRDYIVRLEAGERDLRI